MANKRFWLGMLVMVLVLGITVAGCDGGNSDSGDDGWTNDLPSRLHGTWSYGSQVLFSINTDGSGTIENQGNFTVQTRNVQANTGEVRFSQGSTERGQFVYSLNGDGDMWIQSGTGPFAQWVGIGSDPSQGRYWMIRRG